MSSIALADALRVALVRMGRRMRSERSDESLGLHHLSAIGAIQTLEEPTLARIAATEGVKPPSMLKTLQHLEQLGYLERSEHPSDGRMLVVRITDKGERMIAETRQQRNRVLAAAIDALDPAERDALERAVPVLAHLATIAGPEDAAGDSGGAVDASDASGPDASAAEEPAAREGAR